jgi:SPP1 family predicted phage head-tail adaptor
MSKAITFFTPSGRNPADGGNVPPGPAFPGPVWGSLRAAGGAELDKAQAIVQTCRHILGIPYQEGIEQDMTFVYGNRTFQINYVEDVDEMHTFLDIYCTEIGQNAGSQQ